jgi:hypothetical protein
VKLNRLAHVTANIVVTLSTLAGCGADDEAGRGTAEITIWGEEYIEAGIPAEAFEDGWSLQFDECLLMFGDIYAGDGAEDGARFGSTELVDLVKPGPHSVVTFELEAGAFGRFGYAIAPAASAGVLHETASDEQRERMLDGGYSIFVSGAATRDGLSKTFAWGFTNTTNYDECVSEVDGKEVPGIVVVNGANEIVQITIHGDHFFYDDLASENAVPRFEAIAAADRDDDGEVTLAELSAVKLVSIAKGTYGTGSASRVDDLGAFVRALSSTIGHFRGEGHCVSSGG